MRRDRRYIARGGRVWVAILGIVLIGLALTIGTLAMLGQIDLSGLASDQDEPDVNVVQQPVVNPNIIRIPVAPRDLEAYSEVTRLDLLVTAERGSTLEQQLSNFATIRVNRETLDDDIITEVSEVAGLVLREDKSRGMPFRRSDFFPKGTIPGPTAAVPHGKRLIVLDPSRISGARSLKRGDRFDLLATLSEDKLESLRRSSTKSLRTIDTVETAGLIGGQNVTTVLVEGGEVIIPDRAVKVEGSGTRSQIETVREWHVAIDVDEFPVLTEAIAQGLTIVAAGRSGHIESKELPDPLNIQREEKEQSAADVTAIESIIGPNRELLVFPTRKRLESEDEGG